MAAHEFLSPQWIEAVRAIREEYRGRRPARPLPSLRVNLTVTDSPFAERVVSAHADTTGDDIDVDLGHLDTPDLSVDVDYATARRLVRQQDPMDLMKAFMAGRIVIRGDLSVLAAAGLDPAGLPALLGAGGDLLADDEATELGARIKAVTA